MSLDKPRGNPPIEAPKPERKRAIGRAVVEGAVESLPGGGVLTGIGRAVLPPKLDVAREVWQEAITDRSNEHDQRLAAHDALLPAEEVVTGAAASLLAALAKDCPDGLADRSYTLDDLAVLLPEQERQAIEDAAFEFEIIGLLTIRRVLAGPWSASLTQGSYEQIDRQVMGWDTAVDAVEIARIMLAQDTGHAPDLHAATRWERRRFNPAFASLLPLFPEGRIRRVLQPDYPSLGVVLADEDRVALRRFVKRAG